MKKIILPLALLLLIIIGAVIFQGERAQEEKEILVVASFYPLFELSSMIGGDRVEVVNLTPLGVDPHDFEPSLRDLSKIERADIFLYNGGGLDPWAEKKDHELEEREDIVVLNMSSYFHLIEEDKDDLHEEDHHHHADPHIWLDPLMVGEMIDIILDNLIKVDPLGEEYYKENAKKPQALAEELHNQYKTGLSDCRLTNVVISHASLGYLAKRYNFEMISISGISPQEEPSPQKMAQITEMIREKGVGHVFFETTIPSNLASTIANETESEVLIFNPAANLTKEDVAQEKNYFSLMRDNLEQLRTALDCR